MNSQGETTINTFLFATSEDQGKTWYFMTDNQFSGEEQKMCDKAVDFIKDNKKLLIETFANPSVYTTRQEPITIFMAGTPGAGKTEVAEGLIEEKNTKPVHIVDKYKKTFL